MLSGALAYNMSFYAQLPASIMAVPSDKKRETELSFQEARDLISILNARFAAYGNRHKGIEWQKVQERLESNPGKLRVLHEMERTGGEPDVVGYDEALGQFIFCDCAADSPKGRRNLCYDNMALEERKEFKPASSAMAMASAMGIDILTEEQYMKLQDLGKFDTKTSSWLKTPAEIRKLGGAIFGDRRYNHVFIYHNGASSYYSGRGFRGVLLV